jgi:hypothetical protein
MANSRKSRLSNESTEKKDTMISNPDHASCTTCGMPMPSADDHTQGRTEAAHCRHCATESGDLKPYEEVLAGMEAFLSHTEGLSAEAAQHAERKFLRGMPAWKDH